MCQRKKMTKNSLEIVVFAIIFVQTFTHCENRIITGSSPLDNLIIRPLFHSFRNMTFRLVGQTGLRNTGRYLQQPLEEFPCDTTFGRSEKPPTSVHKLRPGDIDIIAAMGDSLTAATGATSTSFMDLFMENRGLAWCIGGQWDWHNSTTLPNILRAFNPKLFGYSIGDSYPFHRASQFNVAEIGAVSADLPYMARTLIRRIKSDRRVNFKKHWKMLTISMGGNDICSFVCTWDDPESLPGKHRVSLLRTLRYIRDNMPRTFVNIVSVPSVDKVVGLRPKPEQCRLMHHIECSCWEGRLYNQTDELRQRLRNIQQEFIRAEAEVAQYDEFKGLQEFAVVYQPFSRNLSIKTKDEKTDYSLLAFDCFHMSQKAHAWAGTSLWNNIMEPIVEKADSWESPSVKFKCPTKEFPYIYTHDN
ncbi:phospholipase B1, membrane-associated-like [Lutzomyia longipalpis]|uniref:phospholipase B1, membrane-associated-like n=1 Tax=Lutzomyia longipalpis TaxID=7200 RepID=UPI00248340A7|nr:phospholipase B1, membrane-associated-like [Lutzomyia longipalpis]XP_055693018.1 phospholipase B1, membrane-associated-like [Lutzomyia longipalpis]